jgi:two-component system, chemotaxis family, sensor kinase CheA
MALDDRAIIDEFVVESREHLADVENQLLAIEAGGQDADAEMVNTVFRAIHSIKGAAGFFGFAVVQELAHELENVLNLVRNRHIVPSSSMTDVLLRAADTLRAMIEDINHSNDVDISQHVMELRAAASARQSSENAGKSAAEAPAQPSAEAVAVERTLDLVENLIAEASEPADSGPPTPSAATAAAAPTAVSPATGIASVSRGEATAHGPQDQKPSSAGPGGEANIRVSVRVLDHLMNLAGELVLSRNQLVQAVAAKDRGTLDSISARLNQVTSEIQEAIMQTRLQVVETVFQKFPRVVRDLSATLGKQCELTVEGEDVELDKSIIEAIGDPLTHLIRNAVDHGIEATDARVKAGKSPKGRIVLKAFHQAGKVNIAVSDDGGGIDAAKLKATAVSRGVITAEQAHEMGEREALRMIFRPGFSMAEKVTNVSGRGVGMDVVKTNIERLGGTVDIDTRLGAGTTINIRLPLTLAIIPSLIVRCGANRFAIPQASISELVRVKANEAEEKIQHVKNADVLRLRGDLLPLVRLNMALSLDFPEEPNALRQANVTGDANIIVVETGHLSYGLIVDGLHDSEEIVVKPLGKHMKNCRAFAGATILGDGQVALILDVAGIAAQACLAVHEENDRPEGIESAIGAAEDAQATLLFSNSPTEQFAVPMGLISRLERVRSDQIDSVGGQEVLQYRGTSLPLLSLEKHITAAPRAQNPRLYVVVFRVLKREVGLIVPELADIRQVSTEVDTTTFREPGVIGSLVVDGKTTRLLDLFELTRAARPDWFSDVPTVADTPQGNAPTIVLAEDSGFFRKQMAGFLESEGYHVLACEDGLAAWDALHRNGQQCDLIVTDLEMPNMNGFELAQNVKNDPALNHLPVIAVTSLASEEDIDRGRRAGIDEYLIKLDRERLMAAVAEHLRLAARRSGLRGRT